MKKFFYFLFLWSLMPVTQIFAQSIYVVTAENGLSLRASADTSGKKIGKIPFGAEVEIVEQTSSTSTFLDNDKVITGKWVKVTFKNFPYFISEKSTGYAFDGFLKKKSIVVEELRKEFTKFRELKSFSIDTSTIPFFVHGDFFGDSFRDLAIMVKDKSGNAQIVVIDYGERNTVYFPGNKNDAFQMEDYNWVDVFTPIKSGEVLWSNYEDDFIDFKDVPAYKKVILSYDALFVHAGESCGGGFIYWKDGKFNWLQQE